MRIPKGTYSGEFDIKKSRFLYKALHVCSSEEVKAEIQKARDEHPKANHVVHAFIIGREGSVFGMSDDGEPKHTAGRPALEVLKGSSITNILVLIIRYFGGIKLGTGGLVKAYGEAAKEAVAGIPVEELIEKCSFQMLVPYSLYEQTSLLLKTYQAEVKEERFETEITISGLIPEVHAETVRSELTELSSGTMFIELQADLPQDEK